MSDRSIRRRYRVTLTFEVEATSSSEARAIADRGALAMAPTPVREGARRNDFRIELDEETPDSDPPNRLPRSGG